MNSPPVTLDKIVWASGSPQPPLKPVPVFSSSSSSSFLNVPINSLLVSLVAFWLETVLVSDTLVTSILPFLVARISSWIFLRIPVEEKSAWANVSGSGLTAFVADDVNLNNLSPVWNCGLPATFGSGIWNRPVKLPPPSENILPPLVPCWWSLCPLAEVGVTKLVTSTLSKNG